MELPMEWLVGIVVSVGVGAFARMARNRSFFGWALVTLAVVFVFELVIRTMLLMLLTGISDTTALSIVVYISLGGMMLLAAVIMPSASSEPEG